VRFDYLGECGQVCRSSTKSGNRLFIPAGSLDSDPRINPQHNIFGRMDRRGTKGISALRSEGFVE